MPPASPAIIRHRDDNNEDDDYDDDVDEDSPTAARRRMTVHELSASPVRRRGNNNNNNDDDKPRLSRVLPSASQRRSHPVVTLDPLYGSCSAAAPAVVVPVAAGTDLDDCISQPENGLLNVDAECSASDSESEEENKDEAEPEEIKETPYVANENEVLGTVRNLTLCYADDSNFSGCPALWVSYFFFFFYGAL